MSSLKLNLHTEISSIGKHHYQSLENASFPFSDYDFLHSLETSNCLGEKTGWFPHYLSVSKDNDLLAIVISYVKTNSYGEYIFDWAFADAYHRNGIHYYPKLCLSIPFTPASGPKILFTDFLDCDEKTKIYKLLSDYFKQLQITSIHYLFADKDTTTEFARVGFQDRFSLQFWWSNQNYKDFDHFLSHLKGKKRRSIQRERKRIKEQNIIVRSYTGSIIPDDAAQRFYPFYLSTINKKQGVAYLNFEFFNLIFKTMKDRILYCEALVNDQLVGASLSFFKGQKLYGRYAGCQPNLDCLHFELCYYQLIEFAITRGLSVVEAGAQGEHKHPRGFEAVKILSTHWIKDLPFREAIYDFIGREKQQIHDLIEEFKQSSPYKSEA